MFKFNLNLRYSFIKYLITFQLFLIKLPNFLSIESTPFDPSTFVPDEDNEISGDSRISAKVENTIRWKGDPYVKGLDTNAKLIRWSDGSQSLLVGDEFFEVY